MKPRTSLIPVLAASLLVGSSVGVVAQDENDPSAPSLWTGSWELTDGEQLSFEESGDFIEMTGRDVATVDASDPRVSGEWQHTMVIRVYGSEEDSLVVRTGSIRLENEDGAWTGTLTGFAGDPFNHQWHELKGEGGYEGLTAVLTITPDAGQLEGVIVPGDLPSPPDLLLDG